MFFHKNKRVQRFCTKRTVFCALFLVLAISVITTLVLKANAQLVPVASVEITSASSHFDIDDPGAWKVKKSAEWIDFGKARITFEISSKPKIDLDKKVDVLMVIDNSGSMSGDKINQVKSDAADLTESLLLNPENRVALVYFNSEAGILSDFTNNTSALLNRIRNIDISGCTNYYKGLLKAEEVLDGYVQNDNRELILLFLTDGLPNLDTPNEIGQYHLLKELYPYMAINGIQYEMGDTVLQPIIDISDNQYIADMSSLNNVLFDAAAAPYHYDNFTITDYINDDYWTVSGLQAISAEMGDVYLNNDNSTQIVTWDLGDSYRTGQKNVKLTIDIDLKPEFIDVDLLLPTNKREIITTSLFDTPDENIDTNDTPILKSTFDVIYDANTPNGCELNGVVPARTSHTVFSTVEMSDNVLSCDNYVFKGWNISTGNVTRINRDYFRMPGEDVYIKAVWTEVDISKSMDGTVHMRGKATLASGQTINASFKQLAGGSYSSYNTNNNITRIEKSDTPPEIQVQTRVISLSNSQLPVYAWYDEGVIYYYSDAEEIYMNADSSYLFYAFSALESVNGLAGWDTSSVTTMANMFYYDRKLVDINGLANWDTSSVTTMANMFTSSGITNIDALAAKTVNGKVRWNTANVTNMSSMFNAASITNIDGALNWDTSSVTTMEKMFNQASKLTNVGGALNWDTSSVTTMEKMFYSTTALVDLSGAANWDTSNVTTMKEMFDSSGITNIDALAAKTVDGKARWNTANVTNMSSMFNYATSLTNINGAINWDTSSVTTMEKMFNQNTSLTNINGATNWDTSSVTTMASMFAYTSNLPNINGATNWDTSSVTTMANMFTSSGITNIDGATNWDTSSVTTMKGMFYYTRSLTNANGALNWDTSSVTNMESMFNYSTISNISGLAKWDTSSVTTMASMFSNSLNITDLSALSNWDTSSVTTMASMFSSVKMTNIDALATKTVNGKVRWSTANVTDMSNMFSCSSGGVLANIDGALNWDTSSVTTMYDMFYGAVSLANINGALNWDVSSVTDMSGMFAYTKLPNIAGAINWDTSSVTTMRFMFYSVYTLTNINGAINWDVSKVKDTSSMFENATNLTTIDGAINWRFTSLENASEMFQHADSLENIDGAINWGLSSLKSASSMFDYAESLTNIDGAINWDLSSLTAMGNMLSGTYSLNNVNGAANWDTSKVTSMSGLLWASHVSNIDGLANWNTSNVTDMDYMLSGIDVTNVDAIATKVVDGVVRWDTSKVTRMGGTFGGIGREGANVSIDLSSWDTSNVTYMWGIFMNTGTGAQSLSINLSGWDTSKVTNMGNMFSYAGDRATSWTVKIPATNGGGINNTATSIYGSTTSVYGTPPSNRSFTLITP